MPTVFDANYLRPKNDDEFEEMIQDVCAFEWGDPDTARFGRKGQKQFGVDVYGRPKDSEKYFAAQCKLRSDDDQLSEAEIEKEVNEAKVFQSKVGPLEKLIIATDAPRDTNTQAIVSKISYRETQNGGFEVAIWFWPDITKRLATQKRLLVKYYRSFLANLTNLDLVDQFIDLPLRASIIQHGAIPLESYIGSYLRSRGIQIVSKGDREIIDGSIILYCSDNLDPVFAEISKVSQDISYLKRHWGENFPVFLICAPRFHDPILSILTSLEISENKVWILSDSEELNSLADTMFFELFDIGYSSRGKLPIIDVTIRSTQNKSSSALLDMSWEDYLQIENLPSLEQWSSLLSPALKAVAKKLTQLPERTILQIDSRVQLPAAFAVGYYMNVRLATVGVWARSKGASDFNNFFWLSTATPYKKIFVEKIISEKNPEIGSAVLEITTKYSIHDDVKFFVEQQGIEVDFYILSEIFKEDEEPLIDEGIAVAYADYVGQLVRRIRSEYKIRNFHLFVNLPSALGVLIGRNLQACGSLHFYWYTNPGYKFAFTLV